MKTAASRYWGVSVVSFVLCAGAMAHAATERLTAAAGSGASATVPAGELIRYEFSGSRVFPGTTREVTVYVPHQYDPARPACVYVNQDGVQFNAPAVFDDLIARGEMPVTIGVFVRPGVLKAIDSATALDRVNRSFEYDTLSDAYARFLLEELLPDIETRNTADGRALRLSRSGNDRAIGGASSGAIAAFTVAWERPEAFTRVFSAIGTYVALRGGDIYATLVRKVEPKPIRIFLQDGSNDLNHFGGDWWMANQQMERALAFAGYEVAHAWGDGGHDNTHATAVFAEAMRWLWRDWPRPVRGAVTRNQALTGILIPGEEWQLVSEGHVLTEGPAVNARGEVFFDDIPASKSYRVSDDGTAAVFITDNRRANGQIFGPDGRLYAVATASKQIIAYDAAATTEVIADGIAGNDQVVAHNGNIYVTEPAGAGSREPSRVWLIRPDGTKQSFDTALRYTNGIALSPDQSLLYVADYRSHWVYSYQVRADGTLAHEQRFHWLHTRDADDESYADGLKCDREGRLYVATKLGIQVCDTSGRVGAIIPTPNGKITNLVFGGPGFDTLYATCFDRVYRRKVNVQGVNAWAAPFKPVARP